MPLWLNWLTLWAPIIMTDALFLGYFVTSEERGGVGLLVPVMTVIAAVFQGALLVRYVRLSMPVWSMMLQATNMLFVVILGFANLYYRAGDKVNWTEPLSRLDAVYVALGTFSTAGTGSVAPTSETARALVTAQMGADIVVGVIALSLVAARLAEARRRG